MNAQAFALRSAAMLFAVSASSDAPSKSAKYAQNTYAKAKVLLRAAGLTASAVTAAARASTDAQGRLISLCVVRSSGSPDIDRALEGVLRRIVALVPPSGLCNGAVMLRIGREAAIEAAFG